MCDSINRGLCQRSQISVVRPAVGTLSTPGMKQDQTGHANSSRLGSHYSLGSFPYCNTSGCVHTQKQQVSINDSDMIKRGTHCHRGGTHYHPARRPRLWAFATMPLMSGNLCRSTIGAFVAGSYQGSTVLPVLLHLPA